jgi:hypothetical protein
MPALSSDTDTFILRPHRGTIGDMRFQPIVRPRRLACAGTFHAVSRYVHGTCRTSQARAAGLSAPGASSESNHSMAKKKRAHSTTPAVTEPSQSYEALRVHPDEHTLKWRFHRLADQRWCWQKMAADQTVIAESRTSFASYSECIADAVTEGYEPLPSAAGLRDPE